MGGGVNDDALLCVRDAALSLSARLEVVVVVLAGGDFAGGDIALLCLRSF